jgi:hypothetical protein
VPIRIWNENDYFGATTPASVEPFQSCDADSHLAIHRARTASILGERGERRPSWFRHFQIFGLPPSPVEAPATTLPRLAGKALGSLLDSMGFWHGEVESGL